ncbi:MAG: minor capsid protein [Clostridia bacterium]|nr:minor capsid protein [Clostridia bacterium]
MEEFVNDKYFVRKTIVYYDESVFSEKGLFDTFEPITTQSSNYTNWRAILDLKTCIECRLRHGKIYSIDEDVVPAPPLHNNCRCDIMLMESIVSGNATKNSNDGADYWLKHFGILPEYYVSSRDLEKLGWRYGNRPAKFAPGKMYSKGVYENFDGRLPDAPGRIWYEADINYYEGRRNRHRILWSNDGLVFVTYDHYATFYEIV